MSGLDLFQKMDEIDEKYLTEALSIEPKNRGKMENILEKTGDVMDWNAEKAGVEQAHRKKNRREKTRNHFMYRLRTAAVAAAAFVLVFTGIVNVFPSVAYAMNDVIILGDLAKAVCFDKSMKACLENEYAQYVGETQVTENGDSSQVYYMVTDASSVSIFFKTDAALEGEKEGERAFSINDHAIEEELEAEEIGSWGMQIAETDIENLYMCRLEFEKYQIPERIRFEIDFGDVSYRKISPSEPDVDEAREAYLSEPFVKSVYELYPDENYKTIVDSYQIEKELEIEGQKIDVPKVDIYPTYAGVYFQMDSNNTDLIRDIEVVLRDEKGREYGKRFSGTQASEDAEGWQKWIESSYFSEAKELTAVIKGVRLLPKEKQWGMISYNEKTIENMPENTTVHNMTLNDDGSLLVELEVEGEKMEDETVDRHYEQVVSMIYKRKDGTEGEIADGYRAMSDAEKENVQIQSFTIPDYQENDCYVEWEYAPITELDQPIEIRVK